MWACPATSGPRRCRKVRSRSSLVRSSTTAEVRARSSSRTLNSSMVPGHERCQTSNFVLPAIDGALAAGRRDHGEDRGHAGRDDAAAVLVPGDAVAAGCGVDPLAGDHARVVGQGDGLLDLGPGVERARALGEERGEVRRRLLADRPGREAVDGDDHHPPVLGYAACVLVAGVLVVGGVLRPVAQVAVAVSRSRSVRSSSFLRSRRSDRPSRSGSLPAAPCDARSPALPSPRSSHHRPPATPASATTTTTSAPTNHRLWEESGDGPGCDMRANLVAGPRCNTLFADLGCRRRLQHDVRGAGRPSTLLGTRCNGLPET